MAADSTSAAREAASDYAVMKRHEGATDIFHERLYAHEAGSAWQRSQPRVVSEAAVEAALEAFHVEAGISPQDWMRAALAAAYAVEEQQK